MIPGQQSSRIDAAKAAARDAAACKTGPVSARHIIAMHLLAGPGLGHCQPEAGIEALGRTDAVPGLPPEGCRARPSVQARMNR